MPTKKRNPTAGYSKQALNLYHLRRIAMGLEIGGTLSEADRVFIVRAFKAIGTGADPKEALGIKGARGQRVAESPNAKLAMTYIATLIAPVEDGGRGMSVDEAIADAAEPDESGFSFGLTEETLRYYWTHNIYGQDRSMQRPIETLPDYPRDKANEPK